MAHALIFNPENDLALASGLEHFTPPKAAVELARKEALLPLWWAEPGDLILAPPQMAPQAESLKKQYGLHGTVTTDLSPCTEAMPWGWSMHVRRKLINAGMSDTLLPSPSQIETIRALSHRRSTIAIHNSLGTPNHLIPIEAFSIEQVRQAIAAFGRAMIKLPWSCSGRGVFSNISLKSEELERRLKGAINRQGSVIIEPLYEPVAECSALYYADGNGSVSLRGFSAFRSTPSGAYLENVIAPQPQIMAYCGRDAVAAATTLVPILGKLINGNYKGWLGVDMLRHSKGLNPCMELNLRITMGVVALLKSEKMLKSAKQFP